MNKQIVVRRNTNNNKKIVRKDPHDLSEERQRDRPYRLISANHRIWSSTLGFPEYVKLLLKGVDSALSQNSGSAQYLIRSLRIENYDPDPAILSFGFVEYEPIMGFFRRSIVEKFFLMWSVANLQSFPIMVGIVFSTSSLAGTIPNVGKALDALESGYAVKSRILAGVGGMDRTTFYLEADPAKLLGNPRNYYGDQDYSSNGLNSPNIVLWVNLICISTAGVLDKGYANILTMITKSRFYGRVNQA